jgi:hypothetical protein
MSQPRRGEAASHPLPHDRQNGVVKVWPIQRTRFDTGHFEDILCLFLDENVDYVINRYEPDNCAVLPTTGTARRLYLAIF